jgi:hypothetical protein
MCECGENSTVCVWVFDDENLASLVLALEFWIQLPLQAWPRTAGCLALLPIHGCLSDTEREREVKQESCCNLKHKFFQFSTQIIFTLFPTYQFLLILKLINLLLCFAQYFTKQGLYLCLINIYGKNTLNVRSMSFPITKIPLIIIIIINLLK